MKSNGSLKFLILTLITSFSIEAYSADNTVVTQSNAAEKPIAQLKGQMITLKDLEPPKDMQAQIEKNCNQSSGCFLEFQQEFLNDKIESTMFDDFIKANHITVDQDEINHLLNVLGQDPHSPFSDDRSAGSIEFAKGMIINWKMEKLLYKKYGGKIIFQQANPVEPVEANCKFLREMEKTNQFTIYDPVYRAKFWEYCDVTTVHSRDISAGANMDIPWWEQKPK